MDLVYIGASIQNSLDNPLASKIKFCDHQDLQNLKLGHDEYARFLDTIKTLPFVKELALISTCNRFETYLWVDSNYSLEAFLEACSGIIRSLELLSELKNEDAELHFYRTFLGFNSGLIAETEISQQIEISLRQCFHMGYLSKLGLELLDKAIALKSSLVELFDLAKHSYCNIAISSVLDEIKKPNNALIMGSGSTAKQSAHSLIANGLHPSKITLVHRSSSSSYQINDFFEDKLLAQMNFQRSKDGYHIQKIKDLILDFDLLVFAIDSRYPVININKESKLKLIDFNSYPSCTFAVGADINNYYSSQRLDSFIRKHSQILLESESFKRSIAAAESKLRELRASNFVNF